MVPEELQSLMYERELETGHAAVSPSQLYRLLECPGSLQLGLKAPVQPSSQYAIDGTTQHDGVSDVLNGTIAKEELEFIEIFKPGMVENMLTCIDYINRTIRKFDKDTWTLKVETKGSMVDWGFASIYGTADVILDGFIDGKRHVFVIDWKFGSGVPVFAEDNDQGLAYAGCVIKPNENTPIEAIHICIVQPPLNYEGEWMITHNDLSDWVFGRLTTNLAKCFENPDVFRPGIKQCKFCPAGQAMMCEHKHLAVQKEAENVFEHLAEKELTAIPLDELIRMFDSLEMAVKYRSELAKYIEAQYFNGVATPGKKFVHGRMTRTWGNEALATIFLEQNLGEKAYEQKLLTPAKAEKVNRKFKKDDAFLKLVEKKPGKPQMVDDDDTRPAIKPESLAEAKFKDVIED